MGRVLIACIWVTAECFLPFRAQSSGLVPLDLWQQEQHAEEIHHSTFSGWCRHEIASETDQRRELARLREHVAPLEGDASLLNGLMQQASSFATRSRQCRAAAADAAQHHARGTVALAELRKHVAALSGVKAELEDAQPRVASSVQAGLQSSLNVVVELLRTAQEKRQRVEAEMQQDPTKFENEAKQLKADYATASTKLAKARAQQRVTQVGQRLLVTALQDQDEFLEDLHTLCNIGQGVYKRMDTQVRPLLQTVIQSLTQNLADAGLIQQPAASGQGPTRAFPARLAIDAPAPLVQQQQVPATQLMVQQLGAPQPPPQPLQRLPAQPAPQPLQQLTAQLPPLQQQFQQQQQPQQPVAQQQAPSQTQSASTEVALLPPQPRAPFPTSPPIAPTARPAVLAAQPQPPQPPPQPLPSQPPPAPLPAPPPLAVPVHLAAGSAAVRQEVVQEVPAPVQPPPRSKHRGQPASQVHLTSRSSGKSSSSDSDGVASNDGTDAQTVGSDTAPPAENPKPKRLRHPHRHAKHHPVKRSSDEETTPPDGSDSSEAAAVEAAPAAVDADAGQTEEATPPVPQQHAKIRAHHAKAAAVEAALAAGSSTAAAVDVDAEQTEDATPPVPQQHPKIRAHHAKAAAVEAAPATTSSETMLGGDDSGDGQALEPVALPPQRPKHRALHHRHASVAASDSDEEEAVTQQSESDGLSSGDGVAAQSDRSATTAAAWSPSRGKHLQRIEKDLSGLKSGEEDASEEETQPKRTAANAQGSLRGGWQSFMKGKKPKKHSDPTTGIADFVQTPTAYTAWKPEQRSAGALTASTKSELLAAEKAFSEFFLQLGSSQRRSDSEEPVQWLSFERSSEGNNNPPATNGESAAAAVASLILERYARNLGSTALLHLSRVRLTFAGLMGLWQRVQRDAAASASGHSSSVGGGGRHDDQTSKWCKDFQQDAGAQQQQAEAAQELAAANLTEVKAEHHLLQKEAQVQDRVLQVVVQGSKSLQTLLGRVTHRASSEAQLIHKLQQQATVLADPGVGGTVAIAAAGLREMLGRAEGYANSGGAEVEDLVRAAIKRRTNAEKHLHAAGTQLRNRLQFLQQEEASLAEKASDHPVTQQGSSLQQHYEQMCKWTLEDIQARKHKEEGERDAIRAALAVLSAPGAVAVAPVAVAPLMSVPQGAPQ